MPVSGDQMNGTLLSAVCGWLVVVGVDESSLVQQWAGVSTHEALALVRFRNHGRANSNRGTGFRLNITATAVGIRTALFVGNLASSITSSPLADPVDLGL